MNSTTPDIGMNGCAPAQLEPGRCPLCGGANECQLCSTAAYKGPCWCFGKTIPDELLVRVPAELRNKACICRECVTNFHREQVSAPAPAPRPVSVAHPPTSKPRAGDFYYDTGGLVVFTEAYHLRRGYCCGSGCRHCPYPETK